MGEALRSRALVYLEAQNSPGVGTNSFCRITRATGGSRQSGVSSDFRETNLSPSLRMQPPEYMPRRMVSFACSKMRTEIFGSEHFLTVIARFIVGSGAPTESMSTLRKTTFRPAVRQPLPTIAKAVGPLGGMLSCGV